MNAKLIALMAGKPPSVRGDISEAYTLGHTAALEALRSTAALPLEGCGDNGCVVRRNVGGMSTNGGCQCNERQLRQAVQILKAKLDSLEVPQ